MKKPKRGQFSALNHIVECLMCGKKTHSVIDNMIGTDLCRNCFNEATAHNEHLDYHDSGNKPVKGCKWCNEEIALNK